MLVIAMIYCDKWAPLYNLRRVYIERTGSRIQPLSTFACVYMMMEVQQNMAENYVINISTTCVSANEAMVPCLMCTHIFYIWYNAIKSWLSPCLLYIWDRKNNYQRFFNHSPLFSSVVWRKCSYTESCDQRDDGLSGSDIYWIMFDIRAYCAMYSMT